MEIIDSDKDAISPTQGGGGGGIDAPPPPFGGYYRGKDDGSYSRDGTIHFDLYDAESLRESIPRRLADGELVPPSERLVLATAQDENAQLLGLHVKLYNDQMVHMDYFKALADALDLEIAAEFYDSYNRKRGTYNELLLAPLVTEPEPVPEEQRDDAYVQLKYDRYMHNEETAYKLAAFVLIATEVSRLSKQLERANGKKGFSSGGVEVVSLESSAHNAHIRVDSMAFRGEPYFYKNAKQKLSLAEQQMKPLLEDNDSSIRTYDINTLEEIKDRSLALAEAVMTHYGELQAQISPMRRLETRAEKAVTLAVQKRVAAERKSTAEADGVEYQGDPSDLKPITHYPIEFYSYTVEGPLEREELEEGGWRNVLKRPPTEPSNGRG